MASRQNHDTPSVAPVSMTPAAVRRVHQLIQGENNPALMLRSYIMGGGCSGFQYSFTFTDQLKPGDHLMRFVVAPADDDTVIYRVSHRYHCAENEVRVYDHLVGQEEEEDMSVEAIQLEDLESFSRASLEGEGTMSLCVDKLSVQYLQGATIDYKDDVQGQRFVINNPNAKTTCGCGSSFNTE